MSNTTPPSSSGVGAIGLLGVAFVVLKLCGVINWPWVWVLAPFWIGLILVVVIISIVMGLLMWSQSPIKPKRRIR